MDWTNLIISIVVLLGVGYLYDKFKVHVEKQEKNKDLDLIKKYLLGDSDNSEIHDLGSIKKPILWLHIEYNINSRNWCNFGSRSNMELNMPYIYLTIQSIINHCGDDFHVCIIDDLSFKKILPDYDVNLTHVADPIRSHLRNLALMKVLYTYGGVLMENSFICLKNIKPLYENVLLTNQPIIGEFENEANSNALVEFMPSTKFIGCVKECPVINDLINYLEKLNNNDFTSQQAFNGNINLQLYNYVKNNKIKLVLGEIIGTKINNKSIPLDKLLTNDTLNLPAETFMLYIPRDVILKRTNYNWVVRMSPEQILTSNTNLGKYLLLSNNFK